MNLAANPTVAIAGVTGAVGTELLRILEERRFPHGEIRMLASARSAGSNVTYRGKSHPVRELTEQALRGVDIAFFGAGGSVSRQFAPAAVRGGTIVIDKTSAFRMQPGVPLVIPEINGALLDEMEEPGIVAVPNCSTIIALVATWPLHQAAGIRRMVISTYQAASGAGAAAMRELEQQAHDYAAGRPLKQDVFGRPYLFNLFSHDSKIGPDGSNDEESKLVRETHKIWADPPEATVAITATCVRVPVLRCHSESINLSFRKPLDEAEARRLLAKAPGVRIVDDRAGNRFPEPVNACGIDDVLVGRIRADLSQPPDIGLDLFVSGDQLRKGAALNAVQIAERLIHRPATVTSPA